MPIENVVDNQKLQEILNLIRKGDKAEQNNEPKALPDHEEPGEKTLLEPRKDDRTKETE